MSEDTKAPEQRRWKLVGKFEADTWEELIGLLRSVEFDLSTRQPAEMPSSVSGGYGSNWVYTITEKPDMTHDKYFEELNAYLEAQKKLLPVEQSTANS